MVHGAVPDGCPDFCTVLARKEGGVYGEERAGHVNKKQGLPREAA